MTALLSQHLQLNLEDVLGSLRHARRQGDIGRLALLIYWDVRKWARSAHQGTLEELSADVITQQPMPSREAFLGLADEVIEELERIRQEVTT